MSDDRFKELREALAAGPTLGRWRAVGRDVRNGRLNIVRDAHAGEELSLGVSVQRAKSNAAYIAAASPDVVAALLAERDMLLREVLAAVPAMKDYAARNPCWTDGIGSTQDPCGAHAWLGRTAAIDAAREAGR